MENPNQLGSQIQGSTTPLSLSSGFCDPELLFHCMTVVRNVRMAVHETVIFFFLVSGRGLLTIGNSVLSYCYESFVLDTTVMTVQQIQFLNGKLLMSKIGSPASATGSPVLDTSDQFEDSLHLEMEPEKFVVEDSDAETEEKLTIIRKVRSGDEKVDEEKERYSFARHNSSIEVREQKQVCKRIDRIRGKRSLSSQNKIQSDKIFKDLLEGKAQQSNVTSPSKDIRELSFDDEGSISKLELKLSQEACSVSWNLNGILSSKKDKPQTNSFHTTDFKEKFMEEVSPLSPTSNSKLAQDCGASPRKQTHRRNDKENYQKGIAENGFVATRKYGSTRTANADSLKMSQGILLECSRNNRSVSPAGEKVVDRRKALIETTNYQNSDALEVTGKWRCPQKGKPSLGPPLKQLRLERWIHRV
ncbi:hypothetical protein CUMW_075890 [Citrus unshiu]|nr:hypothetical protein CUMW_075890 [Citrus unshiu]